MRQRVYSLLDAGLVLLGAAGVIVGVAQLSRPAAWIVGGAMCLALGLIPTRR